MNAPARLSIAAALLAASSCIPSTSAYLRVPVEMIDGAQLEAATVHVPLDRLAVRMSGFAVDDVAFYHEGREPLPHELLDLDGDGAADVAQLSLPIAGDGSTRLIAVCPAADNGLREGPARIATPKVMLRFDRAQR